MAQDREESEPRMIERRWKEREGGAFLIALLVVVLDILALALGTIVTEIPVALSLACVGVITFIGVLLLSNYLSRDPSLAKKEMRKAIAASFTLVYLSLLAVTVFGGLSASETELAKTIVGHFTWVIGIIVAFYFGSRAVEEALKRKGGEEKPGEPTDSPSQ